VVFSSKEGLERVAFFGGGRRDVVGWDTIVVVSEVVVHSSHSAHSSNGNLFYNVGLECLLRIALQSLGGCHGLCLRDGLTLKSLLTQAALLSVVQTSGRSPVSAFRCFDSTRGCTSVVVADGQVSVAVCPTVRVVGDVAYSETVTIVGGSVVVSITVAIAETAAIAVSAVEVVVKTTAIAVVG